MNNSEYLTMFVDETHEHLQAWSSGLLELERSQDEEQIPVLFRAAHTIKGMAMTMGFSRMGELTHRAENLLDAIRNKKTGIHSDIIDVLLQSVDMLEQLLDGIESTGEEPELDADPLISKLTAALEGKSFPSTSPTVGMLKISGGSTQSSSVREHEETIRFVADQAMEEGYRVFEIELGFEDGCQMPMARWAQVLQQVDQNQLLLTIPQPAVLETGDYNGTITFVLATDEEVESLGSRLANVFEVVIKGIREWSKASGKSVRGENLLPEGKKIAENPSVVRVIEEALKRGFQVYEVGIRLQADTALKSVRAYMVFEAIGGQDHLLYTNPTIQEIEEENFGTDIQFVMWSKEKLEVVKRSIESISEIELVEFRSWKEENEVPIRGDNVVAHDGDQQKLKNQKAERGAKRSGGSVRVDTEKLDLLMNLFSELVIDKTRLERIQEEMHHEELSQTVSHMSRVANDMQALMMAIRMVPVDTVFSRFPRMVRDTAKKLNKEIEFTISGEETELDRIVVEEIGDPIMHILRNSLDHGIESAMDRRRANKPEIGHIYLRAYSAGNSVFIEVEDDGGGINREAVLKKAMQKGIINQDTGMTDEQVYQLLFASGFSTASEVTELSGRGVGLDVVKSAVESLSGRIDIQSEYGKGTKFTIQLPTTLAIMQGLMVEIDEQPYLLPQGSIMEVTFNVETKPLGGKEVVVWRDTVVPVIRARDVFALSSNNDGYMIFLRRGEKTVGMVVDNVLGQREVVLKALDKRLRSIRYLSGATILGDGTVALILDPNAFFSAS